MRRALDAGMAILLLFLLAVPMALLACLVAQKLGRPILFRQTRIGRGETAFTLYKFRSMTDARDATGTLRPDRERLVPFGRWLRATSLDELPQLFNIVRGDMTFVGPRPLLPEYLPLYDSQQKRRHEVLPGITGWAQINGRNTTTWQERFRQDIWYVDHRDVFLDVAIVSQTLRRAAFRRSGAGSGEAPMPPFTGSAMTPTLKSLAIVGGGGHGRSVADWALASDAWSSIEVFDDNSAAAAVGPIADLFGRKPDQQDVVVAIGDVRRRLDLLQALRAKGFTLVSVVHPNAVVSIKASVGEGVVVGPGAVIGPGAELGDGVIVNSGAIVEHDCRLGDGVHIAPGAALGGQVVVGERSWIGIGSSVRQSIMIGCDVTVGAGAAVVSDMGDGLTVLGVPARAQKPSAPS